MQCKNIVEMENRLKANCVALNAALLLQAKRLGFSDRRIAFCLKMNEDEVSSITQWHR